MKMHDGELNIGADLAAEPVAGSSPNWQACRSVQFEPTGTANMTFRLGCQFYVRLRRRLGEQDADRDAEDGVIADVPAA